MSQWLQATTVLSSEVFLRGVSPAYPLLPLFSSSADLEFVKTFLYTYQSFATPDRLLKKLVERYNVVRPSGMSFKDFAVVKQTIQARVINAIKLWIDLSVDFKGVWGAGIVLEEVM